MSLFALVIMVLVFSHLIGNILGSIDHTCDRCDDYDPNYEGWESYNEWQHPEDF